MAGGIRVSSLSSSGAYIFSALMQHANSHPAVRPAVYQVDEIYLLHGENGGQSFVIPPTTAAIGVSDTPPAPLPIDLSVVGLTADDDSADLVAQLESRFAAGIRHVWVVNAAAPSFSVYDGIADHRVYQPGDVYAGDSFLAGFSLDVSALFGIAPDDSAQLRLEDQAELRWVLYPVIFEKNKLDGLDRVMKILASHPEKSRGKLLDAIQRALDSTFAINSVLPMLESEEEGLRAFLEAYVRRLRGE